MHNSNKRNLEFQLQFCETNLRYLSTWEPLESQKINYMKSEISRLQILLNEMKQ